MGLLAKKNSMLAVLRHMIIMMTTICCCWWWRWRLPIATLLCYYYYFCYYQNIFKCLYRNLRPFLSLFLHTYLCEVSYCDQNILQGGLSQQKELAREFRALSLTMSPVFMFSRIDKLSQEQIIFKLLLLLFILMCAMNTCIDVCTCVYHTKQK